MLSSQAVCPPSSFVCLPFLSPKLLSLWLYILVVMQYTVFKLILSQKQEVVCTDSILKTKHGLRARGLVFLLKESDQHFEI